MSDFVRAQKHFVLIEDTPGYVARKLLREGATIVPRAQRYRGKWVFEVELPGVSAVWPPANTP